MALLPLGLLLCVACAALGAAQLAHPGATEGDEMELNNRTAALYFAALEANTRVSTALGVARGLASTAKRPAYVDPERTLHGEGYFAILGDWGNPFSPGTDDGAKAYWGPHWKCNVNNWGDPTRCRIGLPEYERDEFAQVNIAKALTKYSQQNGVQFVINLGDSLYPAGFESPEDARWQSVFEDRYADISLQVPWLSALGNHDWGGFDCYMRDGRLYRADSQIGYDTDHKWQWPQNKTTRWVMPSWFYKRRINFGNTTMDIFVIVTNWVNEAEACGENPNAARRCDPTLCRSILHNMADTCLRFLETELPASDADWKFVVGHRPLDSLGRWLSPHENFVDLLRRNNVSMYIAGHRHTLEEHWVTPSIQVPFFDDRGKRPGAVLEVVSGAGGGAYSDGTVQGFTRWGFNGVKVTKTSLDVDYVSDYGRLLKTVRVDPPCAQLWGSQCEWEAGEWSPPQPCCAGLAADGCTIGLRTREVHCTAGNEAHCANSPKPSASELCLPAATTPVLRSTGTSSTTATTTTASQAAPGVTLLPGVDVATTKSPQGNPNAKTADPNTPPRSATVILVVVSCVVAAACTLAVALGCWRCRPRGTGMDGAALVGGVGFTTPRVEVGCEGKVAGAVGPILLGAKGRHGNFKDGGGSGVPQRKSAAAAVAATDLEVAADAEVEPIRRCSSVGLLVGRALPPPSQPPIPEGEPSPCSWPSAAATPVADSGSAPQEDPHTSLRAPHERSAQSSLTYFELSAASVLAQSGTDETAPAGTQEVPAESNAEETLTQLAEEETGTSSGRAVGDRAWSESLCSSTISNERAEIASI